MIQLVLALTGPSPYLTVQYELVDSFDLLSHNTVVVRNEKIVMTAYIGPPRSSPNQEGHPWKREISESWELPVGRLNLTRLISTNPKINEIGYGNSIDLFPFEPIDSVIAVPMPTTNFIEYVSNPKGIKSVHLGTNLLLTSGQLASAKTKQGVTLPSGTRIQNLKWHSSPFAPKSDLLPEFKKSPYVINGQHDIVWKVPPAYYLSELNPDISRHKTFSESNLGPRLFPIDRDNYVPPYDRTKDARLRFEVQNYIPPKSSEIWVLTLQNGQKPILEKETKSSAPPVFLDENDDLLWAMTTIQKSVPLTKSPFYEQPGAEIVGNDIVFSKGPYTHILTQFPNARMATHTAYVYGHPEKNVYRGIVLKSVEYLDNP